jgi:hypothetical protein
LLPERTRQRDEECGQEGEIDRCNPRAGQHVHEERHHASRQPQERQQQERRARRRVDPGPVADRRQQESRHDRRDVPEEHLVGVPGDRPTHRVVPGLEREPARQHREPDTHEHHAGHARPQEEGAEAQGEQRHACGGCRAIRCAGDGHGGSSRCADERAILPSIPQPLRTSAPGARRKVAPGQGVPVECPASGVRRVTEDAPCRRDPDSGHRQRPGVKPRPGASRGRSEAVNGRGA